MKAQRYLIGEAIKEVLVNMAVNDELPLDMTNLDIHEVVNKAEKDLQNDEDFKRAKMIERLANLVSEDDVTKAYFKLVEQAEIDDSVYADEVVSMWEPVEYQYSVLALLDEIDYIKENIF
jgi:hypothetical protein